jgi:hypothetical protein
VSEAKEQVQNEKDLHDVVLESDKEPLCEEVAKHNQAIKGLKAPVPAAKQKQVAAMATIFSTTTNFFRGDDKTLWDKIVTKQTKKDPWTNHRGIEQSGVRGKTMSAWKIRYILMLKTVFANNAVKQQKFYLTLLHLSPRQKVRAFLQRATMLAG